MKMKWYFLIGAVLALFALMQLSPAPVLAQSSDDNSGPSEKEKTKPESNPSCDKVKVDKKDNSDGTSGGSVSTEQNGQHYDTDIQSDIDGQGNYRTITIDTDNYGNKQEREFTTGDLREHRTHVKREFEKAKAKAEQFCKRVIKVEKKKKVMSTTTTTTSHNQVLSGPPPKKKKK